MDRPSSAIRGSPIFGFEMLGTWSLESGCGPGWRPARQTQSSPVRPSRMAYFVSSAMLCRSSLCMICAR